MVLRWANKLLWGEERQTQNVSGTDALLTALDTYYATGGQGNVNQTAAVEFALGLIARAFMMAETTPAIPALDPLTLSMLVRQTLAQGNAVFEVDINRATGNLRLLPVANYKVFGGVAPETWSYAIEMARPGNDDPVKRNDRGVGHCPCKVHAHGQESPGLESRLWLRPWRPLSSWPRLRKA